MAAPRLDLNRVLGALDKKQWDFYDRLTDEEKKAFTPYLMLRYASSVSGDFELASYYLLATNHYANEGFFDIAKHPKMQWLCLAAASPGMSKVRHPWIGFKKKADADKKTNAKKKTLLGLYPNAKESDIDVMCELITDAEIKEDLRQSGQEP